MVTIHVQKNGEVTMSASGYPGEACRRVTEIYRKALGGDILQDTPTAEASEPEKGAVSTPQAQTA